MISFSNNNLESNFLNENDLRTLCPLAFRTEPTNPDVSERYVQATTIDVVRDMEKLGWYPVQAKQCREKKNSKGIRSFHMIAFQNPNVKITRNGEVECFPRIILTNSHDGFNSFKFMLGLFRLVCSNGLVVAVEEFANLSIRHINYTFEELRETVRIAMESVPEKVKVMNDMKNTILTQEQKEEMAMGAMKIRKGLDITDHLSMTEETVQDLLEPVRNEDKGDDLWSVFNVLQEKMIKGQFYFSNGNKKARKQRGITSIKKDIDINTKLFNLANNYLMAA
jgi:hypothetical protein